MELKGIYEMFRVNYEHVEMNDEIGLIEERRRRSQWVLGVSSRQ